MLISKGPSPGRYDGRRRDAALVRLPSVIVAVVLGFLLGSCAAEPEPDPGTRSMPTLDASEYDGLTPEELRLQAEPMTLEEAERLGIVDTSIHIEFPMNPESIPLIPIDTGTN